jgi:DNA polymerase-3 subunit epsilon
MTTPTHPLREYVLIDTETTGFGASARLVEVAALHVRSNDVVRRYESLVRPDVPIPRPATRVHGISDAMVRTAPPEAVVVRALRDFIGARPLVAHNAGFDAAVLRGAFSRAGLPAPGCVMWCSVRLARRFVADAPAYNLGALAQHLALPAVPAHRAMADALTTQALVGAILVRATASQFHAVGPSTVL